MAVTAFVYARAMWSCMNKEADLDTDAMKAQLHTSTYTPVQATHRYRSDLTNELGTASGYTAGGLAMTTLALSNPSGNIIKWAADNAVWTITTPSITFRYLTTYDNTPATDATRPLVHYVDTGGDQTISSTTLTFQWNASGVITVTAT
jgi:hypothetical protein